MKIRKREEGATLIELLTVVVIIGIMASIAVPRFAQTLPGMRLRGDTKGIASTMRLARMKAVAEGKTYGLYFDNISSPQKFVLFEDKNLDENYNQGQDSTIFSWDFHKTTNYQNIGFANNVVVFRSNGSSNGGSLSLITESGSDSLAVDVLPSTGRVRMTR